MLAAEAAAADGNSLELKRQAQIQKNRQRLSQLGLKAIAQEVASAASPAPRPKPSQPRQKKRPAAPPPLQRVLRSRGLIADDSHAPAARDLVNHGEPESVHKQEPHQPFPLEAANCEEPAAAALLSMVHKECQGGNSVGGAQAVKEGMHLCTLELQERHVAKVVHGGATVLQFLPSKSCCILAVGDKQGNVGIWPRCLEVHSDEDAAAAPQPSVLQLPLHDKYVSGLQWLGSSTAPRLLTSSYDRSLVVTDLTAKDRCVVHLHDDGISALGTRDENCILIGDTTGDVAQLDLREPHRAKVCSSSGLCRRKVNSIHAKPGSSHEFVTSSSDASVQIWDIRKLKGAKATERAAVQGLAHKKSCHSAWFHPGGKPMILSTSYDDTIAIWGETSGQWTLKCAHKHNNQTGRWITPFQAQWVNGGMGIVCGDMKRGMWYCQDAIAQDAVGLLQSELMTAICPRLTCHSELGIVAAASGSGRVHLWMPPQHCV